MTIEMSTFTFRSTCFALFAAALALFAFAACGDKVAAQIPEIPNWQLFWHDEFDGKSLNATNWQPIDRQNSSNNEKQYYRPEQVTVANGNLQLTATNQPL